MMRLSPVIHRAPPLTAQQRIHAQRCTCERCRHPEISATQMQARRHAGARFARDTFLGLALGMGSAAAIDWLVGGPGILSIFGVGL